MTDETRIAPTLPGLQPDGDGFYEIQGDYTFRLEHEGTEWRSGMNDRSYRDDKPETPPAWRIFHDWDRTDMHMPADWSPERVKTTFEWYLRGEKVGEEYGIKLGKNKVSQAVSMLRDLGIGTVLLPTPAED